MIRKKMLSPLIIAAALVAFPAWSADAPPPPRHEKPTPANPLGATSKVNPLEPSPGCPGRRSCLEAANVAAIGSARHRLCYGHTPEKTPWNSSIATRWLRSWPSY